MALSFKSSVFLILTVVGLMSVIILVTQSDYLSRRRVYIQRQDGHRSRMHVHRSQEALRHYRAWKKGQSHLPKDEENAIPGDDMSLMRYRAGPPNQRPLQIFQRPDLLKQEDDALRLYRSRSKQLGLLPKTNRVGDVKEDKGFINGTDVF